MMKKTWPLFLMLLVGLLVVTGCKKPQLDFIWEGLEGSGYYHSQDNSSGITLNAYVRFNQPRVAADLVTAFLDAWQYQVWAGQQLVLDIHDGNHNTVLGDHQINLSTSQGDELLWVYINTSEPKSGDLFNGAVPDRVTLTLWVRDSNGEPYKIFNNGGFEFVRD